MKCINTDKINNKPINSDVENTQLELFPLQYNTFQELVVRKVKKPLVSIVIPVHNEFCYTYNCIKSIIKHGADIDYEVIVADDCSTDETVNICEIIKNIKVIRNNINLRFLKNCKNAVQHTNGKYVLCLNNDTVVQKNWLSSLVELIESDDTIGIVGSKLVYPDGSLQEAGGILWKDGSAWNFGHKQDPSLPQFNYVKEADYISGASMMFSKKLWDEIGGFDEQFSPAYCEDSDFAFEVRKRGYKVLYQPQSVVVHFEGISNGKDLSSGQKAYQVINSEKFFNKWKDTLESEHFANGENVFLAKDRSRNKKTILVIDHYIPEFDKDAGSKTTDQYLDIFVNLGYNVKFLGDNFFYNPNYAPRLEQKGIELLCGTYYSENLELWLKENVKYIDVIYLNRPHISIKYIGMLRKYSNAKILYYGMDLHYLRMEREYAINPNDELLADIATTKEQEYSIMEQVHCSYFPSIIEVEEVKSNNTNIKVRTLPAYIFNKKNYVPYSLENRKDIMFVGGFCHAPNIDGIKWFIENIFPDVLKFIPSMKVYILGSNPTDEVKNLGSENVIIVGYVSEDELHDYYKKCRLSIAPLRYGAGIKGKVIEAMAIGMPIITTPIGAEGINNAEKLMVCSDEKQFAESIIQIYDNENALSEIAKSNIEYIAKNYSVAKAKQVVLEDF